MAAAPPREDRLPEPLLQFLAQNGVSQELFQLTAAADRTLPRFVRLPLRCGKPKPALLDFIAKSIGVALEPTPLPRMYRLGPGLKTGALAASGVYKRGTVFGIDLASAFAVEALDLQPGLHVLDLCCAPGAKLCMIAEAVNSTGHVAADGGENGGSVSGVDVSLQRLRICRSLVKKHRVRGVRLFHGDGTLVDLEPNPAPVRSATIIRIRSSTAGGKRRRAVHASMSAPQTKRACTTGNAEENGKREAKAADNQPRYEKNCANATPKRFDRVLVDAECTHDGSVKHLAKYRDAGWEGFSEKVLDSERLAQLCTLQRGLIANGFRMLAPGGTLVYSTCSFCRAQNEDIVHWLVSEHAPGVAVLIAPPERHVRAMRLAEQGKRPNFCPSPGFITNTIRFDPIRSGTSGLFIARVTKKEQVAVVGSCTSGKARTSDE